MLKLFKSTLILLLSSSLTACSLVGNSNPQAIVTGHPLATEAAKKVLKDGGTAADAFIAASMTMTITEPFASGLGGGFFAIYYDKHTKSIYSVDAREEAPSAIEPKSFLDSKGEALRFSPERQSSAVSAGIPGAVDGFALLHNNFGKLSRDEILNPVIKIAKNGFEVSEIFARSLLRDSKSSCEKIAKPRLSLFPETKKHFFKPVEETLNPVLKCNSETFYNWQPLLEGDKITNEDFAKTLEDLKKNGFRSFYTGPIAEAIVQTLNNPPKAPYKIAPSKITMDDMKNYRAVFRAPIIIPYRAANDRELFIATMGPPSSGGLAIAEMINLLDDPRTKEREFDLSKLGSPESSNEYAYRSTFLMSELYRMAFYHRNRYLADEDFVHDLALIKESLTNPEFAKDLRERYMSYSQEDLENRESIPKSINKEPKLKESIFNYSRNPHYKAKSKCVASLSNSEKGTSHIAISDKYGNVISATVTIEAPFGNGMVVPGYGFLLNNELTDFEAKPGACNSIESGRRQRISALGKTSDGRIANQSIGAKRPRSSMSPVIVLEKGKPIAAFGAAGGATIIGSSFQVLLNLFEHGMTMEKAVKAPRLYNLNSGYIALEKELYEDKNLVSFIKDTKSFKPLGKSKTTVFSKMFKGDQVRLITKPFTAAQGIYLGKSPQAVADPRRGGTAISF